MAREIYDVYASDSEDDSKRRKLRRRGVLGLLLACCGELLVGKITCRCVCYYRRRMCSCTVKSIRKGCRKFWLFLSSAVAFASAVGTMLRRCLSAAFGSCGRSAASSLPFVAVALAVSVSGAGKSLLYADGAKRILQDVGVSRTLWTTASLVFAADLAGLPATWLSLLAVEKVSRASLVRCLLRWSLVAHFVRGVLPVDRLVARGPMLLFSLVVGRLVDGVVAFGIVVAAYALTADNHLPSQRYLVAAGITAAQGLGSFVGSHLAATEDLERLSWQRAHLGLAAASLVAILFAMMFLDEPERGTGEPAVQELLDLGMSFHPKELVAQHFVESERIKERAARRKKLRARSRFCCGLYRVLGYLMDNVLSLLRSALYRIAYLYYRLNASTMLIFAHSALRMAGHGCLLTYMKGLLFDTGLGNLDAASVTLTFTASCGLGCVVGGFYGHIVHKRSPKSLCIVLLAAALTTPWSVLKMVTPDAGMSARTRLLVAILSGVCSSFSGANLRAMLLNVNLPGDREVTIGVLNLLESAFMGIGPFLCATTLKRLDSDVGSVHARSGIGYWKWSAFCLLPMVVAFSMDQRKVRRSLQQFLETNIDKKIRKKGRKIRVDSEQTLWGLSHSQTSDEADIESGSAREQEETGNPRVPKKTIIRAPLW